MTMTTMVNTSQVSKCFQCFDTVGWVSGRASGLYKLSVEVLTWLSVWSEVQMICIWSSWWHCHLIISCSRMVYLSGASLLRLSWKEAIKRMSCSSS